MQKYVDVQVKMGEIQILMDSDGKIYVRSFTFPNCNFLKTLTNYFINA